MWRRNSKFLFLVIVCIGATSCITKRISYNTDFASWYNSATPSVLHPQVKVFHYRTDSSAIFFGLNNGELNFVLNDSVPTATVQIKFKLWSLQQPSVLTDSATVNFYFKLDPDVTPTAEIKMHAPTGLNYRCEYSFRDINSKLRCDDKLQLTKDGTKNNQYFLVKENDEVFFNPYASVNDSLQFYYFDNPNQQLTVKYYVPMFAPALPSYSNAVMKNVVIQPDSIFQISSGQKIQLQQEGVYKIMAQRYDTAGIIVLRFHDGYPEITDASQMIFPLRYFSKNDEYEQMMNASDSKAAIDTLWLHIANMNLQLANQLISEYYNRVQDANQWFTTYKEGWMTDRGMTLMVYGYPDHVYRELDREVWNYNGSSTEQPLSFTFLKNENSFSPNDFVLQRDYFYISSWNTQVYQWRHGLINQ